MPEPDIFSPQHKPDGQLVQRNDMRDSSRDDPQSEAKATPAYGAALVVSLIAGLAATVGAKFGLGVSGVVTATIAVAVFMPVMAGVLLFNIAAKPAVAKRLTGSAFWMLNAFGFLSLVVAILTISSAFFGAPMNLRDKITRQGEVVGTGLSGEMTKEVYDLSKKAADAYVSDKDESLRLFTQALTKDPDNYILLANRSTLYLALDRNTEAIADALKAQNAYAKLGEQQLRREKAYKLILDNTLINAYFNNGKYEDVATVYAGAESDIANVADTIMRIYFSAANSAFAKQKWQTARDTYYKVQAMARALNNYEMEVKTYLNIANAAYWLSPEAIRKSVSELDDGLQAINLYKFEDEDKRLWAAQFHNAKGLALLKLHDNSPAVSLSQAKEEYSSGIALLQNRVLTSDEARSAYAYLLGNLADIQRLQKDYQEAQKSYRLALGLYMKVGDHDGISRQAYGLGKIFLDSNPPLQDAKTALACAQVAINLGQAKPAEHKDEDQKLMEAASQHLNQIERGAVGQQLLTLASAAFDVTPDKLKLYLK